MKIIGINKLYEEGFKQRITSLVNIETSCDIYFNSKVFKDIIDNKNVNIKYDDVKDKLVLEVVTYVNIPMLDRVNEKILCNYYKKIKYSSYYEKCKLVNSVVEILD